MWIAGQAPRAPRQRRPFLTAKRLLTNRVSRPLRTDTINVDQRLKITSLTFLFTDLKGSTELYERVGDLIAFDLVNAHFRVLQEIVAGEAGAVVKTIGDAVMATFTPDRAVAAALRMREAMRTFNETSSRDDLLLKIGIHEGPAWRSCSTSARTIWDDSEHRRACPGTGGFTYDFGNRAGRYQPAGFHIAANQRAQASVAAPCTARHHRRGRRLRDSMIRI